MTRQETINNDMKNNPKTNKEYFNGYMSTVNATCNNENVLTPVEAMRVVKVSKDKIKLYTRDVYMAKNESEDRVKASPKYNRSDMKRETEEIIKEAEDVETL